MKGVALSKLIVIVFVETCHYVCRCVGLVRIVVGI